MRSFGRMIDPILRTAFNILRERLSLQRDWGYFIANSRLE